MIEELHNLTKPRIGVAVIIKQNDKIIVARRLNNPMPGSWQLPGGWIKFGETPEQAVQRQLSDFYGLHFGVCKFVTYSNNIFDQFIHTISLYFMVDCYNGNQQNVRYIEQEVDWFWADWNDLPQPLFLPLQLLKSSGFNPFAENQSNIQENSI